MGKYSRFIGFVLIFCMVFYFSLTENQVFAYSGNKQETQKSNRVLLVISAFFVAVGVYIGYLAINEPKIPDETSQSGIEPEIKNEAVTSVTEKLKPIQIARPPTKFSNLTKTIHKFLAACARPLPDTASEVEIANNFLEIFSIKGLLSSLRSHPDANKVFEVIPTDQHSVKSGLKVQIRQYSEWIENLPDEPIVVSDKNLDEEFFSALKKIAPSSAESVSWPNDCPSVHLFLSAISYKSELSYSPETKAGKILNSFLLSEYDFLRSEKWRKLIIEFRNDY